jgi:hypothetical protein
MIYVFLVLMLCIAIVILRRFCGCARGEAAGLETALAIALTPVLGIGLAVLFGIVQGFTNSDGHRGFWYGAALVSALFGLCGWFLSIPLGFLFACRVGARNLSRRRAERSVDAVDEAWDKVLGKSVRKGRR